MTTSQRLLDSLKNNGADFFVSVPCKLLAGVIDLLETDGDVDYLTATREEEALGLCAGAYLGGKTPVLLMQNTGLGNSIASLCSLALYYGVPVTMIMSHRGSAGEKIGAQIPMGKAAQGLLETIGVPVSVFSDPAAVGDVGALVEAARVAQAPVGALLGFDFWKGQNDGK